MNTLTVLLYDGSDWGSRLIERVTGSAFCHAAIRDQTSGTLYEAIASGVRKLDGDDAFNRARTAALQIPVLVDDEQLHDATRFLEAEVGTRYPWSTCVLIGLARLTGFRWDITPASCWCCSGLVAEALARAGVIDIQDSQQVAPGDLVPLLLPQRPAL